MASEMVFVKCKKPTFLTVAQLQDILADMFGEFQIFPVPGSPVNLNKGKYYAWIGNGG